jgi:hypothetical protein
MEMEIIYVAFYINIIIMIYEGGKYSYVSKFLGIAAGDTGAGVRCHRRGVPPRTSASTYL